MNNNDNNGDNMTTNIGWVIDRDYLTGEGGVPYRVGIGQRIEDREGDNNVIFRKIISVERGLNVADIVDPVRFRLLDDDGEVYYGGAIDRSWLEGGEEYCFAPLDYGMADAGCTEMHYRNDDGEWAVL